MSQDLVNLAFQAPSNDSITEKSGQSQSYGIGQQRAISNDAIIRRAMEIGIDNAKYYYIAIDSLKAPLPENWIECVTDDGYTYYYNEKTEASVWDYPDLEKYKILYRKALNNAPKKSNMPSNSSNTSNLATNNLYNTSFSAKSPSSRQRLDQLVSPSRKEAWSPVAGPNSESYSFRNSLSPNRTSSPLVNGGSPEVLLLSASERNHMFEESNEKNNVDYWYEKYETEKKNIEKLNQRFRDMENVMSKALSDDKVLIDERDQLRSEASKSALLLQKAGKDCKNFLKDRGHDVQLVFEEESPVYDTSFQIVELLNVFQKVIGDSLCDEKGFDNSIHGLNKRIEQDFQACFIYDKSKLIDVRRTQLKALLRNLSGFICNYGEYLGEIDRNEAYINRLMAHIAEHASEKDMVPLSMVRLHKSSLEGEDKSFQRIAPLLSTLESPMAQASLQEAFLKEKLEKEELQSLVDKLRIEEDRLKSQVTLAETRINDYKEREETMFSRFNQFTATLQNFQPKTGEISPQEIVDLKAKIRDLEAELEVSHHRAVDAEKKMEEILRHDVEIQGDVKALEISLTSKLEKKTLKIGELKEKIEELEGVSKNLYEELQKALSLSSILDAENQELKKKMAIYNINDTAIEKLKIMLTDESNRCRSLESTLAEVKLDKENLQENLQKCNTLKVALENQNEDLRHEMKEREEDILRVRKRLIFTEEEKAKADEKIKQLQIVVIKLNDKIMDIQGRIRVFCRIRPLSEEEFLSCRSSSAEISRFAKVLDEMMLDFNGNLFEFDRIMDPLMSQQKVFEEVEPLIRSVLYGCRVCLFAYGQTGSGKTHTMIGPPSDWGILLRTFQFLFYEIQREFEEFTSVVSISMVEIYNEKVIDLLNPVASSLDENLELKTKKNGQIMVENLSEHRILHVDQIKLLFQQATGKRKMASNNVNEHSSRSHLILMTQIFREKKATGDKIEGLLYLVDLAGSERIKMTAATGQRLREAQHINKSLSCLGDVIAALATNQKHIPYRNSKLTYLLQNVIRENSKVAMFVNINPLPYYGSESLCSLNFASRCRAVALGATRQAIPSSSSRSESLILSGASNNNNNNNNSNINRSSKGNKTPSSSTTKMAEESDQDGWAGESDQDSDPVVTMEE